MILANRLEPEGLNEAAGAAVKERSQNRLLSERIEGFSKPNPSDRRFSDG